ncbi:MAG: alpha-2-macroglobulin family protein [Caldilineaceae bacterium]
MALYRTRWFRLLFPLMIFILGCPPSAEPPPPIMDGGVIVEEGTPNEAATGLFLLGDVSYLAPASKGALLVQVRPPYSDQPAANARVQVLLNAPGAPERTLFTGQTDAQGVVQVNFDAPTDLSDPHQTLTIVADTPEYGQFQRQQEIYVGQVYNVLLSTDKPVYQPGQQIHLRTLALDATALKAAQGQLLVLTVADPAGNKLMRKELVTSAFGIAAADFQLAGQAASGDYVLTAEMGPVTSSRTVEVKPYTLPRFQLTFAHDQPFYLPAAVAKGTVDAQYFFGKPVAGGQVTIKGFVTDVDRVQVFEVNGVTDATGLYPYEFQIPDYFVGQLENNTAQVDLEITVVDTANHSESIDESITVAEEALLIEAIPESGVLRPGLANIVYLQTTYPDGRAAPTTLTIGGVTTDTLSVTTDELGLATITVMPEVGRAFVLSIHAEDENGQTTEQTLPLEQAGGQDAVLIRPERVQYQIGETLNIDLHVAGNAQHAYLDVIKGRQTFGLVALPVVNGVAQAAIDIDGSLLGTLELNAYVITDQGEIVRDRRYVLVNPAPATVTVQADAEQYRPGDTATLAITVNQAVTSSTVAGPNVVGVSIVDESVFAVGAQDPGFARTYFLLERELQKPRYEIHDFAPLGDDDPSPYDQRTSSRADAQQLALGGFFAEELAALAHSAPHAPSAPVVEVPTARPLGWVGTLGIRMALVMPLMGLAFYDGSRRRRYLLVGLVILGVGLFLVSCAAAPGAAPAAQSGGEAAAPAADAVMEIPAMAEETTATQGQAQPPRLRQFFPETLYWLPELATDANGHAQIEVPIADSITTWRVSVLASDQAGNLGSAQAALRVFQDFFVEPDLPRFLTVGDALAVPVSLFNYLDEPQTITLAVTPAGWFALQGEAQVSVAIQPNEVTVAYIPLRVTDFGVHEFQITATGSAMSDAVLRQVEILPDGKAMNTVASGKLAASQRFAVTVPPEAIAGSAHVTVKIYSGIISQVIDGLEGMLQQPYGCFEQTSSTTYPNVLVLDYLQTTNQINPRLQLQAEQYINLGYQRLLGFEVQGMSGGFSLFGDPPPQTMLTAYGLMEFTDMSQVSYVDPALIDRTVNFLFQRQQPDGSWQPQGMTIESGLEGLGADALLPTAYVTWALADAGYAYSEPVQRAVGYLQAQLRAAGEAQSTKGQTPSPLATPLVRLDPYAAALVANALIAANPAGASGEIDGLIRQLLDDGQRDANGYYSWSSGMTTYMGGYGNVSNIETAAMTAIALLRLEQHPDIAQGAIDYVISQRDGNGMFYSTQTTVVALKALLLAAEQGGEGGDATVTITLNNERVQSVDITDGNSDVVQQVSFDDLSPNGNELAIFVEGERALHYQVITQYYLPWSAVPATPVETEAVRINVAYDRTELQVNDTVSVTANVELVAPGVAGTLLVDLGVPPGFQPLTEDWDRLVEQGVIARYEWTGRQILVYLTDFPSGRPHALSYRLQARFPIQAQTPSSQAYDYYTPDQQATAAPQRIVVKLGTPEQ